MNRKERLNLGLLILIKNLSSLEKSNFNWLRKEKFNKIQQCIKIFIIPYLYKAQHVSDDTPPIIRSIKLHWQPLVFHMWKVVGGVVGGRCQAQCEKVHCSALSHTVPDSVHHLHVQQPSTYEKPEAASAVLCS